MGLRFVKSAISGSDIHSINRLLLKNKSGQIRLAALLYAILTWFQPIRHCRGYGTSTL